MSATMFRYVLSSISGTSHEVRNQPWQVHALELGRLRMLPEILLQELQHHFEGLEDIDVEGTDHSVRAGLGVELVHRLERRA